MVITDLRLNQKVNVVDVITAGCNILGIINEPCVLSIIDMPALSTNKYQFLAMVDKAFDGQYRLYILKGQSKAVLSRAIAHELIHLKQFISGRLTIAPDRASGVFDGVPILPPYSPSQPHEVEAFDGMVKLLKAIKKYLKQNK